MFYRSWIQSSPLKITECYGDTHWELFDKVRRKHNDNICSETNKLVLRLDKLINSGDGQKPDLDKSIIEWTSDDLVQLCPYCAKSFTFARRRHHCRVCGAILCNSCSKFLEYKAACKLVKPAKLYTDPYDRIEDQLRNKNVEEMPKIRTCEDCKRLLDRRIQTIEDYYNQPTFLEFYENLRKSIAEADELMLSQSSMSSNSNKETTLELKSRIQELRHNVALMSSKISKMVEREESGRQAYLLKAIGQSVAYWLKESLESKINRTHGYQANKPSGWAPEQPICSPGISGDEDPLLIQIKNLEEYIKQAKLADRYEEVSALEASKRDLEIEYFIQQDMATTTSNISTVEDQGRG